MSGIVVMTLSRISLWGKEFLKNMMMKKSILVFCLFTTFISCEGTKNELEESSSGTVEMEAYENEEYESDGDIQTSPVSSDCKDKFDYENNNLVYDYSSQCQYWEDKLDEYLKRNNTEISTDQKLQNISSDISLEAYVKKIHGFSTLEEAKQAYIKAGGNGEGLFRFNKPKFNK